MEIENDENGVITRNDEFFDFDIFHELNLTQLELEKPIDEKCTATTTVAPHRSGQDITDDIYLFFSVLQLIIFIKLYVRAFKNFKKNLTPGCL